MQELVAEDIEAQMAAGEAQEMKVEQAPDPADRLAAVVMMLQMLSMVPGMYFAEFGCSRALRRRARISRIFLPSWQPPTLSFNENVSRK